MATVATCSKVIVVVKTEEAYPVSLVSSGFSSARCGIHTVIVYFLNKSVNSLYIIIKRPQYFCYNIVPTHHHWFLFW
jgi:hypothetical protein